MKKKKSVRVKWITGEKREKSAHNFFCQDKKNRDGGEGWDTFDWLCIFVYIYTFFVLFAYCHRIGCWELFPHILLSKDIFDWNGLYSISWSLFPPEIDIDENDWKKFDLSGMLTFEFIVFVDGRTIVEPDDDDDDDDDGGGDAKPLLNIEFVR